MNIDINEIIDNYFKDVNDAFSSDDFHSYLKSNGIEIRKTEAENVLRSSDFIIPLEDNKFITRAGAFTMRYFSFKPTREEIAKGHFILGHRCMPFCTPEANPDDITVMSDNKFVKSDITSFSMNLALDTFALFGEGYAIPYIINDKGNKEVSLSSVQYSLPEKISLMSWSLADLKNGEEIKYGDRVICRILDWQNAIVEMYVQKKDSSELVITKNDIERENWYSVLENSILDCISKYGPTSSIEEQLSFVFLQNQEKLCIENCGSVEEFLSHTTKIAFEPYGVETRIWKAGEIVPYTGEWNSFLGKEQILIELALVFSSEITNAYIKNSIYQEKTNNIHNAIDVFTQEIIPKIMSITGDDPSTILLNIKKRRDILEEDYNPFNDFNIAEIRDRTLTLFSKVSSLLCSIGCSSGEITDFPQQELVVLSQLYGHLIRLFEELENGLNLDLLPKEEIGISLDGMEDTFEEISTALENSLKSNTSKGFKIF